MSLPLGLSSLFSRNSRAFLIDQNILFDCFGVRFVRPFSKKNQAFKMAKKPEKWDKHGQNFVIFSQAIEQTWYQTSAYDLSALGDRVL